MRVVARTKEIEIEKKKYSLHVPKESRFEVVITQMF
jgi:hypothetical protein